MSTTAPQATAAATTRAAAPAHRASVVSVGIERIRWELTLFFRNKQALGFTLFFPIMLLLLFGSIFGDKVEGTNLNYSQVLVAGIVASGAASVSFMNLAIGLATERDEGGLKRLAGTPMPKAAYFIGKIGLVVVTAIIEVAMLLAVGVLMFDLDLPSTAGRWFTFAWVLLLGLIAFSLLGIALAGMIKNAKAAPAVVNIPFVALQFISGVYVPFWQLGSGLRTFASLFPLKWMAQGFRSVFLPDAFLIREPAHSWQHGQMAIALGIWCVIGAILCARTFRWTDER